VATVNHLIPGKSHFPTAIKDGQATVHWLRTNVRRFGLDADRIGVLDVSSRACLLGTTGPGEGSTSRAMTQPLLAGRRPWSVSGCSANFR
jgi:acetyl esterase/lipase